MVQDFEDDGVDFIFDNFVLGIILFMYMILGNIFVVGDGGLVGVILDVELDIEICFWGDMDGVDENFDVIIEGSGVVMVNVQDVISENDLYCEIFILMVVEVIMVLVDGQIIVIYDNLGLDWYLQMILLGVNFNMGNNNFNVQVLVILVSYSYFIEDVFILVFCVG